MNFGLRILVIVLILYYKKNTYFILLKFLCQYH